MEIARYIYRILRSNPIIMMSWGFHDAYAVEDGLRFSVDGYIHSGSVQVKYNAGTDSFDVSTFNRDGSTKNHIEDIYLDCLVPTIDGMVERTPDYKERVKKQYSL
jgi:hypothetical protein